MKKLLRIDSLAISLFKILHKFVKTIKFSTVKRIKWSFLKTHT